MEPCMCALRHLTSRHEDEETARHVIVHELAGLPVVARILHAATAGICQELGLVCQPPQAPVTSWMLIKAMVGLLRNLSVNLDSHSGMREYGLVTGLFLLLYATQHEIIKVSLQLTFAFCSVEPRLISLDHSSLSRSLQAFFDVLFTCTRYFTLDYLDFLPSVRQ